LSFKEAEPSFISFFTEAYSFGWFLALLLFLQNALSREHLCAEVTIGVGLILLERSIYGSNRHLPLPEAKG